MRWLLVLLACRIRVELWRLRQPRFQCPSCGNRWRAMPARHGYGTPCPLCLADGTKVTKTRLLRFS